MKRKLKLENNLQRKITAFSRVKANIGTIFTKKRVSLKRKRQVLGSDRGMGSLESVILSVLKNFASSSLRDVILITHEENISLKQQAKNLDARGKRKQHILSNMGRDTCYLRRKNN